MKKIFNLFFALFVFSGLGSAQVDTIKGEEAKELIKQITKQAIDTTKFLSQSGKDACSCIDSIKLTGKDAAEISKEIAACIDKEVTGYELALKIYYSMVSGNKEISLSSDKNSNSYKYYYFEIERWLRDSCTSLGRAVASNNKQSENSVSGNDHAVAAYNRGLTAMEKGDFTEAASYFATAVALDSVFAFAWDNLGISYRRLGKYDEALAAYNKSLQIDPKGHLPLQNIAVVYEFKKEHDKALEAYMNILKYFPDDPEAYYGAGRIHALVTADYEKALQHMCKAYNLYIKLNSPYRVDAEKNMNFIFSKMKEAGKENRFYEILEENNIKAR